MLAVSLTGKKSRRRLAGVVEKVLLCGDLVVVARRRPTTVEEEQQLVLVDEVERKDPAARASWAACLRCEPSFVFARAVNI